MQRWIGLNLLGGYSHADGGHERLPRKSRALLAYLVMQGPRGASRDRLGDLLWDSNDTAKARHSLRQCLASLRRALADDAPDPIVAVDRDRLATRAGAIEVDAHRMEALAQSSSLADLAAAAALYQGPFLNDFDVDSEVFQAWARAERGRLESVAAGALRRLAAAASQANDSETALAAATRLTALDPLNEHDQQLLMRTLASCGHRAEALRQYERLKESLRVDLGVPPNETSRALARALRAESLADNADATDGRSSDASAIAEGGPSLGVSPDPAQAAAPPGAAELPQSSLRPLAVLACEWIGMETLPEERQREAVTACYRRCGEWLEAQGAHVARNASDGVVAYFGYDETREENAETCARTALELRSLAKGWSEEFATAIQISAGIAFGCVVVRKPSGEKGPEAVGSAVNLACRLRSFAAPGEILIEPEARSLVRGLFTYGDFRSVDVKGHARPLQIAPVLDETETESRFEALRPQRLGPMVGREEEMERLARRWRQANEGEGAAVLLVGEPGIGKSRLVQAFLDSLGDQAGAPLRLFCSPHGAESALHPFASYLKRAAGVTASDSEARRRAKLAAMIADAGLPSNIVPWLAPVAGISDDSRSAPTLSPAQDRDKRLDALISVIGARAARHSRAALIIIEDVHWADPTTVELVDRLVESASRQRVLVILTARPEYSPAWAGRAQTTSMTLGRLPAREARKIVAQATAGSPLPSSLFERIVEWAEGVPLFLEELSRAVVDKQSATDPQAADGSASLDIPPTLQALLLARLDRLGSARPVAQIAAALGRTFGYRLIRAASTLAPEQIDGALARLVEAEWVWRRGATTEAEYVFRHALLQDAAYHSLPREQRRTLHERLVATLETHCPDIVAAQPEVLARHCAEAGLMQKAAALWSKAGQLSLARSGLHEAAAHFERALAILETLPSTKPGRAEQLVAQVGLANALMHTKGYAAEETRAAFDRAQHYHARADELGEPPEDPSILLAVLHGFWVASHVAFDGPAVRKLSQTFMTLANKRDSTFAHAVAHRIMGTSLLFLGDVSGGRLHLDRALELYDPVTHRPLAARFGQDVGVAVLSNRPLALWLLGQVDDAEEDAAAAVAMARSVGQLGTLLYMLTRIAWIKLTIGDFAAADPLIAELSASSSDVDASYWTSSASILRGCYDGLVGDAASGVELIGAGVAASRTRGVKLLRLPWYLHCLAKAHARLGDMAAARDCLKEAFAAVASSEEAWPESELHRLAGEFALASNDPDRFAARRHFERSLAVARRQQAKSFELRAAISLARLERDLGEPSRAVETLRIICDGFAQGLETPDLRLGVNLLAELASQTRSAPRSPTLRTPFG